MLNKLEALGLPEFNEQVRLLPSLLILLVNAAAAAFVVRVCAVPCCAVLCCSVLGGVTLDVL